MKKIVLVLSTMLLFGFIAIPQLKAQTADSKIVLLNEANFENGIKSGLVLVDFYADWCRPCKMMQPVLEEVANEYQKKIVISKVNTDQNKNLSQKYQITGIPAMIVFKDGKEIARIIGYHDKAALVQKLEAYF
ncbi:MAG: thioredoxin [Bacteroidales bacterium]|nr:thioredoxin [Bacteroidales bacterium]